ncbi:M1 family aminopeptidase [Adhaeribacter pallidiroseus]|uniref:Aminopeptidase N n=1 Tax=Adhaeribacter pallidiroseus TaxID=2072847 RepID=A0A369QPK3_9BACT|nr:M1 family aminopeptidase [Adhaeribacter pallidiroseus]RDC64779.1 Membrane alanyl aminopeptidase [Adhaeribacter pallidiroseus]
MHEKFWGVLRLIMIIFWGVGCKTNQATFQAPNNSTTANTITAAPTPLMDTVARQQSDSIPEWVSKPGSYHPTTTRLSDLIHTQLKIRFDWSKQQAIGEAILTLKPFFYPQNTAVLDAKGFTIQNVKLVSGTTNKDLQYTYDKLKLTVKLDKQYTRNQEYKIQINYVANPNNLQVKGSAAITSDKGLYFINPRGNEANKPKQIWTQGETEANSAWMPTIDSPNERMTQEIYLTVDPQYTTLSNGLLVSSVKNLNGTRTDYWKMDKPHAPYLAMVAVGEFAVVHDKWRNLNVDYYVEPKFKNTAKAVFGNTPEMMEFFSKKLGVDFPWQKYASVVVRDYVSGAMENTTASVFMESLQLSRRELLDTNWDFIIAHELFHQWFGDLVTLESWANLPLNESFANYSEYLWEEHKYGKPSADALNLKELNEYLAEAETKQEPLIRYHYQDKEDMFDSHSYAKGGRVLHMLRNYVGDDAFFTALQNYLKANQFTSVELAELRMAFEDVTGEDLNWFFDQWFLKPGHPDLKVVHAYQNGQVQITVTQQQDSLYTPIYRLPLTIAVWNGKQKKEHAITITKAQQSFHFPAEAKPDLVVFDAQQQLLGKINQPKTDAELMYQFYNVNQYLPKYEAITKLTDKVNEPKVLAMMRAALQDETHQIRSAALAALAKYTGPELNALFQELQTIAKNDKKSVVRADAITAITALPNPAVASVLEQSLSDSSYAVVAAGIEGLITTKNEAAAAKLKQFDNVTSGELLKALSGYYARFGNPTQLDWFMRNIDVVKGENLYFFTQNFGGFLMNFGSQLDIKKGLTKLEDMARNHETYFIRLAAFQALSIASDSEEQRKLLADIKSKEKDPKLIRIYSNIP